MQGDVRTRSTFQPGDPSSPLAAPNHRPLTDRNYRLSNSRLNRYIPDMMIDPGVRRRASGRFDSPQQEVYLNLWRTYDRLRIIEDEVFGKHDLTAQQYNALRVLRAAHPQTLPTLT